MKCSHIQKLLSDYLDESVSDKEKAVIAEHLKTCPACQQEMAVLQRLGETLDLVGSPEATVSFKNKVINEIQKTAIHVRPRMPFFRKLPKWALVGTTAVIIVITALSGNHMGRILYQEFARKQQQRELPVVDIYQYGICFQIPESSFSVRYLNLKM
jgi:predicted anti-sigma-YlaC factor YlaD